MIPLRKLKLDSEAIQAILNELDGQEADGLQGHGPGPGPGQDDGVHRFSYRAPAIRTDLYNANEVVATYMAPSRKLGRDGVFLLVGNLVHPGSHCKANLITVSNDWQAVTGVVESCRYLQGTGCVYELFLKFDRPIDPASFAPSAVRTHILVADDSPTARRLLTHMLEPLNVDVRCVENGIEAVRTALTEVFDVIMMDVEMPGLGGLDAVRLLRSKGYIRAIVAVTSLTEAADRDRCFAAGCDDYLPKPPPREQLAAVVNRAKPEPLVSTLLHQPDMVPLIDDFVHDLPGQVARLEAAFGAHDMNALATEVRVLKGEAAGYGFETITMAATNVERVLRAGNPLPEIRKHLSILVRMALAARPATSSQECAESAPGEDSAAGHGRAGDRPAGSRQHGPDGHG